MCRNNSAISWTGGFACNPSNSSGANAMKWSFLRMAAYAAAGIFIAHDILFGVVSYPARFPAPIVSDKFKSVATELEPKREPPFPASALRVSRPLSMASENIAPTAVKDRAALDDISERECAPLLATIAERCRLESIYFMADNAAVSKRSGIGRFLIVPKAGSHRPSFDDQSQSAGRPSGVPSPSLRIIVRRDSGL
jgi:hypothetical protein